MREITDENLAKLHKLLRDKLTQTITDYKSESSFRIAIIADELVEEILSGAFPSPAPEVERLKKELNNRCRHCGAKIIDNCPICGAPQCCPQCCQISNLKEKIAAKDAIDKALLNF